MAVTVFSNAYLALGATDISAYLNSVSLDTGADALDNTNFAATTKTNVAGLKTWGISAQGHADFADNLIDEILYGLVGTAVVVHFKPVAAAISTANPDYTGTGIVTGYNITGQVDGVPQFTLTIASGGALDRDVTP